MGWNSLPAFRVWDGIHCHGCVGPEPFLLLLLQIGTASTIAWEYLGSLGSWEKEKWADTKAGTRKLEVQGEGAAQRTCSLSIRLIYRTSALETTPEHVSVVLVELGIHGQEFKST
jgi:hypothetical protein